VPRAQPERRVLPGRRVLKEPLERKALKVQAVRRVLPGAKGQRVPREPRARRALRERKEPRELAER